MLKEQGEQEVVPRVAQGRNFIFYERVNIERPIKYPCHDNLPKAPMNLTTQTVAHDVSLNDQCIDKSFLHKEFKKVRPPTLNGMDKVGQEAKERLLVME